jgi:hypothetical protein
MPRRPCSVTQSAIARAIRAAKQEGAHGVRIEPDGTMFIVTKSGYDENPQVVKERVAEHKESVF